MARQRRSILGKNKVLSVSLPPEQHEFLKNHPKFNFSMFVQFAFDDYIKLHEEVDRLKEEYSKEEKEVL